MHNDLKQNIGYTTSSFNQMNEYERLMEIFNHPYDYSEEIPKRKRMIMERLESGRDGFTKSRMDGIRTSIGGGHADLTADIAIDRTYYENLLRDDVTFTELLQIEDEDIPKAYKSYFILKRSIFLYERVVNLFSDDIAEVLRCRAKGLTIEAIADEINESKATVNRRIRDSKEQISVKIIEVLENYDFDVNE